MAAPPIKKQRTDAESEQKAEKAPPPSYGSRTYWDERYEKNCAALQGIEVTSEESLESVASRLLPDNDSLPFHEWYFSYSDLRPLILALILGERDEAIKLIGDTVQEESEQKDDSEQHLPEEVPDCQAAENKELLGGDEKVDEASSDFLATGDSKGEFYEDDSDEEEEPTKREGLARDGPISVLEVGCGDVPLGKGLYAELKELESKTGAKVGNVVKRILCCDYSETVVRLLKSPLLGRQQHQCDKEGVATLKTKRHRSVRDEGSLETPDDIVEYVVADARKLPYSKCEFQLVLEKGTLDAMLSDKEFGVSNCVLIVTECARVLSTGGYLVIVSHLNANTNSGLGWLDEVVVPGLRAGGGDATWEIEVHGNDDGCEGESESDVEAPATDKTIQEGCTEGPAGNAEAETEDVNDSPRAPSGSPGPAVYIIRKKEPSSNLHPSDADEPAPIPLKFFGY